MPRERTALSVSPGPIRGASGHREPTVMSPRTRRLLHGPILPTLLLLAWPNILVMLAQASTGLIETWWVSGLGTDALAGMALVFPGFMLMQMLSAGAMGGGISSAIARALGNGRREDANALVLHAIIINRPAWVWASPWLFLVFGPAPLPCHGWRRRRRWRRRLQYPNVVFAGTPWSGCERRGELDPRHRQYAGTIGGGMRRCRPAGPALAVLIFGYGPIPAMGMAGAGAAVLVTTVLTMGCSAWYLLSSRSVVRPGGRDCAGSCSPTSCASASSARSAPSRRRDGGADHGLGRAAGPDAVAGYGTGSRLEYLLIPLVFGLGAPLVGAVGTNVGAGEPARALRAALLGGAVAFCLADGRARRGNLALAGSACSTPIRPSWRPAPPICGWSGRPTGSSAWALPVLRVARCRPAASGLLLGGIAAHGAGRGRRLARSPT